MTIPKCEYYEECSNRFWEYETQGSYRIAPNLPDGVTTPCKMCPLLVRTPTVGESRTNKNGAQDEKK